MQLHFNCPETGKSFATEQYSLVDNRGVVTDSHGGKVLEATVAVAIPCPHCRGMHRYPVRDIACPWTLRQ